MTNFIIEIKQNCLAVFVAHPFLPSPLTACPAPQKAQITLISVQHDWEGKEIWMLHNTISVLGGASVIWCVTSLQTWMEKVETCTNCQEMSKRSRCVCVCVLVKQRRWWTLWWKQRLKKTGGLPWSNSSRPLRLTGALKQKKGTRCGKSMVCAKYTHIHTHRNVISRCHLQKEGENYRLPANLADRCYLHWIKRRNSDIRISQWDGLNCDTIRFHSYFAYSHTLLWFPGLKTKMFTEILKINEKTDWFRLPKTAGGIYL